MDICIASDENYAILLKVVMTSVIENNSKQKLTFHVFVSEMEQRTINSILQLKNKYVQIIIYDMKKDIATIKAKINNDWANRNSYVAYARLYMPFFLPKSVKKFLYLDCDTLVLDKLDQLFAIDMGENIIAAVQDVLPITYKNSIGLDQYIYINSGVILVNNELWVKNNITKKIIEYCQEHEFDSYPDQDALNIVLKTKILSIHPKYCVFYPEYSFPVKMQIKGRGYDDLYYSSEELIEAKESPVIIHYVDTILGRPWQSNCVHPLSENWHYYFNLLNIENGFRPKKMNFKQRVFKLLYLILPNSFFSELYYSRRNSGIKKKIDLKGYYQ